VLFKDGDEVKAGQLLYQIDPRTYEADVKATQASLVLSAQYESWSLPLAIILVVPMCILCAVTGMLIVRMPVDIFVQIGFLVPAGLAVKNTILIVEFARQLQHEGQSPFEVAVAASRLRLRPIVMTSFAFIAAMIPLMVGTGAGAEMRQ
jgi:HAE1 family hydrophobic/amphiphilic exporter-1